MSEDERESLVKIFIISINMFKADTQLNILTVQNGMADSQLLRASEVIEHFHIQ